jgi:nucleoside-diphosphate-sugar epimerase
MLKSSCSQSDPLRILLTGATGSLGSNVVAEAARCGLEARAVLLGTPNDFAAYNGIEQAPVLMDTRRAWLRRGVSSRTAGQSAGNFLPRSNCSLDCSAR